VAHVALAQVRRAGRGYDREHEYYPGSPEIHNLIERADNPNNAVGALYITFILI
jgi:hypothetical protein